MTDRNLADFLTEYLQVVFSVQFSGVLVLWDKQTKKSRHFDPSSVNKLIEAVAQDMPKHDLYIANATQTADLAPGKRGGNDTVAQVGSIFVDIDFANEKEASKNYPKDEEEALRILAAFPRKPTMIQNSGGGLHAIFVLKEPILCKTDADRKRAQSILKAFQAEVAAHFKAHGREIDDCSDLARVYRAPLSYNHKYDKPRLVDVLHWDPEARIDAHSLKIVDTAHSGKGGEASRTGEQVYPPADHDLIREHYPWYEFQTGEGAFDASEPEWLAAGSITAACEKGCEIFHDYSRKHPEYKRREAEQKFRHIEADIAPFRCDTIADRRGGEKFCKDCAFRGKIKSPVQLGDEKRVVLIQRRSSAAEQGWADLNKDGRPRASFRNAILCLIRLGAQICYDLFRLRISISGIAVQEFAGDMSDDGIAFMRKKALDAFDFDPGKTHIADAAHMRDSPPAIPGNASSSAQPTMTPI